MVLLDMERAMENSSPEPSMPFTGRRDGREDAFGVLYEEYVGRIYRYIYTRTGRTQDAEDLTQEVFLKAFKSISAYRDRGKPFCAWLIRIAHNLLVDRYRHEHRQHFVPILMPVASSVEDPVAAAEQHMRNAIVMKAIARLLPGEREVVSLRFGAGLSIAETAEAMGKSQGAVKTLQHRALAKLRMMVGEQS